MRLKNTGACHLPRDQRQDYDKGGQLTTVIEKKTRSAPGSIEGKMLTNQYFKTWSSEHQIWRSLFGSKYLGATTPHAPFVFEVELVPQRVALQALGKVSS
jgi:hypothetical protein